MIPHSQPPAASRRVCSGRVTAPRVSRQLSDAPAGNRDLASADLADETAGRLAMGRERPDLADLVQRTPRADPEDAPTWTVAPAEPGTPAASGGACVDE